MNGKGLMTAKSVAEQAPDTKFKFRDAFPSPGVVVDMGKRGSGKTG